MIVAAAAKRAGEVSRAGRENVLTKEADCTLAAAVAHLSECRVRALSSTCTVQPSCVALKWLAGMEGCRENHRSRAVLFGCDAWA